MVNLAAGIKPTQEFAAPSHCPSRLKSPGTIGAPHVFPPTRVLNLGPAVDQIRPSSRPLRTASEREGTPSLSEPACALRSHGRRHGRIRSANGLHHIDHAAGNVERSLAFYLDLLGPLGWKVTGGTRHIGAPRRSCISELLTGRPTIREVSDSDRPARRSPVLRRSCGAHRLRSRDNPRGRCRLRQSESVRAKIHFSPEKDRDEPGYYAFFVLDPDGMRIEVFTVDPSAGGAHGFVVIAAESGTRFIEAAWAAASCVSFERRAPGRTRASRVEPRAM